jgi:hypothetical protein
VQNTTVPPNASWPPADPGVPQWVAQTVDIDAQGDGQVVQELHLPADLYQKIKEQDPTSSQMEKRFPFPPWQLVEDFDARFDDNTRTLRVGWTARGMARIRTGQVWEAPLPEESGLAHTGGSGNQLLLTGTVSGQGGKPAPLYERVTVPNTASGLQLLQAPNRVSFELPAPAPAGSQPNATINAQVRSSIMPCLANLYGQPKLQRWWVAKAVFKNTGDQPLYNYRVEFSLRKYSPSRQTWDCPVVVPGQTLVDTYFPKLDLDKLAELGMNEEMDFLEIAYSCQLANGEKVQGTYKARRGNDQMVFVLGRSFVEFPDLHWSTEDVGRADEAATILAALADKDERAIKDLAGWALRQAGATIPPTKNEQVQRFLGAVYDFMGANLICDTQVAGPFGDPRLRMPAGGRGQRQWVPTGAEMLKMKTGSSLSLALLCASVCEAAGLRPILVCTTKGSFTAVALPEGGQVVAVDPAQIRMVDFAQAVRRGDELWKATGEGLTHLKVDLADQRQRMGLRHLPRSENPSLADLGITPPTPGQPMDERYRVPQRYTPVRPPVNRPTVAPPAAPATVEGKWFGRGQLPRGNGNYEWTLALGKDGNYQSQLIIKIQQQRGQAPQLINREEEGTYKTSDQLLVLTSKQMKKTIYKYRRQSNPGRQQNQENLNVRVEEDGIQFDVRFDLLPD